MTIADIRTPRWKMLLNHRIAEADPDADTREALEALVTAADGDLEDEYIAAISRTVSTGLAGTIDVPIVNIVTLMVAAQISNRDDRSMRWIVIDRVHTGQITTMRDLIVAVPSSLRTSFFDEDDIAAACQSVLAEKVLGEAKGDWSLFSSLATANGFDSPEQAWQLVPVDQREPFVNGDQDRMLGVIARATEAYGKDEINADYWVRFRGRVENLDFPTWRHFCDEVPGHLHTSLGIPPGRFGKSTSAAPSGLTHTAGDTGVAHSRPEPWSASA